MMTDTNVAGEVSTGCLPHIKKELDGFSECSPSNSDMYSPTTTVMNEPIVRSSEVKVYLENYPLDQFTKVTLSPLKTFRFIQTMIMSNDIFISLHGINHSADMYDKYCLKCTNKELF